MFPGYLILSLGPPLTQLGLWREARILIRPSSALHRRQSRTVSLRQCCLSKQQNKSGGTSGLCSFYLSLTYCCGSTDGSRATSISANDDKWAGWWNFMMTVLRCENKRGVYMPRFLWDFGGKSDYKWIYSTYCPQPPLKTISLRKLVMCPVCKWGENNWSSSSLLASGLWRSACILGWRRVRESCGGNNKSALS